MLVKSNKIKNLKAHLWLLGCMIALLLVAPSTDAAEEKPTNPMAYKVTFHGLENHTELDELVKQVSESLKRLNEPPASRFLLSRRANKDQKLLTTALKSRGYFDGIVEVQILGESAPFEILFNFKPKERYYFAAPILVLSPANLHFVPPSWEKLKLITGAPAISSQILTTEADLVQSALEQGYPWAKAEKRQVSKEEKNHLLLVQYTLNLGPLTQIGAPQIKGSGTVDVDFLLRRIPWHPGVLFHPKRLEEARQAFVGTNLYSVVRLQLAKQPDAQGYNPLNVELKERKHRTWKAGGGFSTDQGIEINGGWEHRNLFNAGERLRTETKLGLSTMTWESSYDKPDFRQRGQKLRFSNKLENAHEEAYENLFLEFGAGVVRPVFDSGSELSLTLNYRLSRVLEISTDLTKSYSSASIPLRLSLDKSNNPLDATEGWRLTTELVPYLAVTGESATYTRWNNRGTLYYSWPELPKLVLAGRAELDTTYGADQEKIPADNRLYAGGGSTVRGYAQQMASPLDGASKPTGGRSLLALSTEARYRVTDTIGVVGFIDGGRTFLTKFPAKELNLLYGAGIGLRYMTPIGPLRLDVATPLERRKEIDAPYQLYMSIGQAF